MSYYKYAEREAGSQINWAEISKGLSDTIYQIDKDRQDKKAAIDEATRKDMNTLADAPKGDNTTASEWTLRYTNDMMNYRLTIDRLLKSGQMDLKDYKIAAQNSKDSTNLLFSIAQEYQDQYAKIQEGVRSGKTSTLTPQIAALNESLSNISTTVPYINPTNGMVYLATGKTGKDGVQQMGDNYVSLQALRNRVNVNIDKYDLRSGIIAQTNALGENVITQIGKAGGIKRTGLVTEISDPTLRDTYKKWEKDTVNLLVGEGYRTASLLADNMVTNPTTGNQFRPVFDRKEYEADKSGDLILFENVNGTGPLMPVISDKQKKMAEEYVQGNIGSYIDKKIKKTPFSEPQNDWVPAHIIERTEREQEKQEALSLWQQIYKAPTATGKEAAKAGILGTDRARESGLIDIDFTDPNNVKLIYSNSTLNRTIPLYKNGKPVRGDEWARSGSEFTGVSDDRTLSKFSGDQLGGTTTEFKAVKGGRAGAPPAPPTAQQKARTYLSKSITPAMINKTESEAVPEILAVIEKLGFDAQESDITGSYVIITAPGPEGKKGASKEFSLNDGETKSAKTVQSIIDFVTSNMGQAQLLNAEQAGLFGDASRFNPAPGS